MGPDSRAFQSSFDLDRKPQGEAHLIDLVGQRAGIDPDAPQGLLHLFRVHGIDLLAEAMRLWLESQALERKAA